MEHLKLQYASSGNQVRDIFQQPILARSPLVWRGAVDQKSIHMLIDKDDSVFTKIIDMTHFFFYSKMVSVILCSFYPPDVCLSVYYSSKLWLH